MNGVTRKDKIRGSSKVIEVSKKVQEARWIWFGHMLRRSEEEHVTRKAMEMEIIGTRHRGRPKKRWKDCIQEDTKMKELNEEQAHDRRTWIGEGSFETATLIKEKS